MKSIWKRVYGTFYLGLLCPVVQIKWRKKTKKTNDITIQEQRILHCQ
jgi:hypothetical protein